MRSSQSITNNRKENNQDDQYQPRTNPVLPRVVATPRAAISSAIRRRKAPTPTKHSTKEEHQSMITEIYEPYLECLKPFSCDQAIRLTAPSTLIDQLSEIAVRKKTSRLDVIRFALSKYIHEELR
jgi:hypothetical protein